MKALVYRGSEDVRIEDRARPVIAAPGDAIIRITTAGLCGSDLHLYHGDIPDMCEGDVLGHEFMGIVEETGRAVKNIRPGDRVIVSALIADGTCWYCQEGMFSLCETTNPNPMVTELYGQPTAAIFGFSHLTGGFDGGQAEYVRVPFADVGTLKVPDDLTDEQVILLTDNLCAGWQAAEMGDVGPGDSVAVFGCGPVGLLAMMSCQLRGAEQLFAIDSVAYRLEIARSRMGAVTVNYAEDDPVKALREITMGRGPNVCIDATGFRYTRTLRHRLQRMMKLETDGIDALSDAIRGVRKGGRVSIVGDYIGFANQFPVGALVEKSLTVRGGQVHVQAYWRDLLRRIQTGEIDPTFVITHRMPLERAPDAYQLFDKKQDDVLKVLFTTASPEDRGMEEQEVIGIPEPESARRVPRPGNGAGPEEAAPTRIQPGELVTPR